MATNEILQFAENDTGTNLLTQAEYLADAQRPIGNQPGVARSKLVNKVLRQSSLIAAAVGQFIAEGQANDVVDSATVGDVSAWLRAAVKDAAKKLGLNSSTVGTVTTSTTLGATAYGSTQVCFSVSAITVTLPSLSGGVVGTHIEFINFNSGSVTVTRAGADTIFAGNANVNSIVLGFGDTLTLVSRGDCWFAVGGSAQFAYTPGGADLVPAGAIQYFARNTAPAGWVKANGAVLNRTTYSRLFAAIGTTFGAGDGSTTFQLPDLRGEFPRGWDDGRGVDTGRTFGSVQAANTPRDGMYRVDNISAVLNFANGPMVSGAVITVATLVAANTVENRPRNLALLACIKF